MTREPPGVESSDMSLAFKLKSGMRGRRHTEVTMGRGEEYAKRGRRLPDCSRGSRDHKRKERVALELGLEGWTRHPLCVASLAEVLLLGWILRLSGPREAGGWEEV